MKKEKEERRYRKMIKFTIIIPTYNVAECIGNAIESIKSQKFQDYEVIIVDDCSNDDGKTVNKINQYVNKKIKLIKKDKNSGAGGARNLGISEAKGEYILFLDSDDKLDNPSVLGDLSDFIKENKTELVFLGFKFNDGSFTCIPNESNYSKEFVISRNKYINVWSICWKREFLLKNKIKFRENVLYEDVDFVISGMLYAKSISYLGKITHLYTRTRTNSNSDKNTNYKKHYLQAIDTIKCIEELSKIYENTSIKNKELLLERINEQKTHLNKRLDRGIDALKKKN